MGDKLLDKLHYVLGDYAYDFLIFEAFALYYKVKKDDEDQEENLLVACLVLIQKKYATIYRQLEDYITPDVVKRVHELIQMPNLENLFVDPSSPFDCHADKTLDEFHHTIKKLYQDYIFRDNIERECEVHLAKIFMNKGEVVERPYYRRVWRVSTQ